MSNERGKSRRNKEDNASAYKKLRRELQKCAICPPNRCENKKRHGKHGKTKPKYKKIDRETGRRHTHKSTLSNGCPPGCPGCDHEDNRR